MATTFGDALIFAIEYCDKFGVEMSDQQMHDFCNLLIEFRDGAAQQSVHPTQPRYFEWDCPACGMRLPSTDTHCPNCGGAGG